MKIVARIDKGLPGFAPAGRCLLSIVLLLAAGGWVAQGQIARPDAPSTRTIQTPEPPARKDTSSERPRSARSPDGTNELVARVEGIVIVKSDADLKPEGVPVTPGLTVRGIPLLQGDDFKAVVAPYIGRPLSENRLRDLQDDIILYCRDKNRPLIDVIFPEQVVDNGMVQIWFLEGTVGEIRVSNEMTRWFRDDFIKRQIRSTPGQSVDSAALSKDIEWLNRNPFRSVDVRFQQGKSLGQSDIVVDVQDRVPLRAYVGYEDTGTRFTGEKRLVAGLNWGNAFGLDHQFNYQYTTDIDFDLVSAHSASYFIPLPWRHTITLFGSYVDAETDFGDLASGTSGDGTSWQISGRYGMPLPDLGRYRHEASAGIDFKRADNTLEFVGGTNIVLSASDVDVLQIAVGYTGLMPDPWGQTSVGVEGFYSPGGITDKNDSSSFEQLRPGAEDQYLYARFTLERLTPLPMDFSWIFRVVGQISSERLLPSEQLGAGGYRTVRGYDERVANGDQGVVVNNELRTPRLRLGNLLEGTGSAAGDYLQGLVFFDYGRMAYVDIRNDETEYELVSVGGGLRYTLSTHLSLRLDYGVALQNRDLNRRDNGRAHLGIVASF